MSLTIDEHDQVVKKLCSLFDKIDPQGLPPLVHQLLRLCKDEHAVTVFLQLRNYFTKNIYSTIPDPNEDYIGVDKEAITEAESTILCHVEEFARVTRLNDLLKLCKNSTNAPDLILDPFLLAVLLTLSCIQAYESQVMDILQVMLSHIITEEEKVDNSAWLHTVIDSDISADNLFSKLIQSKIGEHDKVMKGLINLSFLLLSLSGNKSKETVTKKLWNMGRIALVTLVKKHRRVIKTVLHILADRIISGSNSYQYTDCLLHLCNVATVSVLDDLPIVIRILEFVNQLPGAVSQRIITAIIPLIKTSTKLRDHLILVLRKALFSKELETRQTAVVGFLQLLRFLKLQGFSAFSQNSLCQNAISGPSVFTQICLEVHSQQPQSSQQSSNINTAICLEVIGILKRCFSQQTLVKLSLYKGLYNVVTVNPEIGSSVLDVLLDHFSQFYISELSVLPPLNFEKVAVIRGVEVVLQEPLGRLILLIQDVMIKCAATDESEELESRSLIKLSTILPSLITRFSKCDLNHFQLDEYTDLNDITPESLLKQEIVKQILAVYEALIAYVVNSCSMESENAYQFVTRLVSLYKGYNLVANFAKNSNKSGKKKGENGDNKKRKQKGDGGIALPKKTPFKIPPTILGFNTIHRLLSLFLTEEVDWLPQSIHREVQDRRLLFGYIVQATLNSIHQMKTRLDEQQKSSTIFKETTKLARLLFDRCLCRYKEVSEFESSAAITCLECFAELISLINNYYHSKLPQFLQETVLVSVDDGLVKQLLPILSIYKMLLKGRLDNQDLSNYVENDEDDDTSTKLLTRGLINSVTTVAVILPSGHDGTTKIVDWLISVAEKHKFSDANDTKMFVHLLLTMSRRFKNDSTLLHSISSQLSHLFPSVNEIEGEGTRRPLLIITNESKANVLPMLCGTLITNLEDIEWTVSRFRSEYHIIPYVAEIDHNNKRISFDILRRKEKDLCQRLTHIILMSQTMSSIAVPNGPCMEAIFKLITKTYSVLCLVTKYFTLRSSQDNQVYRHVLFNKSIEVAGTHLSSQVADLIIFVESYEMEHKKVGKHANNHMKRQAVLIPKLVSELENFTKLITFLSKKCKDSDICANVKLTTTRDFRLSVKKLETVMNSRDQSDEEEADGTTNDIVETEEPAHQPEPSQSRKKKRTK